MFTSKNDDAKLSNQFIWFRKSVICKQILYQLSLDSSYSIRKLQYLFKSYLSEAPQFIIKNKYVLNLMIDGTYLNGNACLVLYYDSKLKYALFYRWTNQEYFTGIKEDLQNLQLLGVDLQSVICDCKKSIPTGKSAMLYCAYTIYGKVMAYQKT